MDDSGYVERINEIRDIIREIVPTNHEVFSPLIDEYEKKINSLFSWKESRYTYRYNLARPQVAKIEGEIMKFTDSIVKNYNLEWAYNGGMIQSKNDILNRILFHQNRLSKKDCETNAHKWLKDEMFNWLQNLYTLINSLHIDCLPESNPIVTFKRIEEGNSKKSYRSLKELFNNEEDFNFAISVLKNVENPVISETNSYLLGKNSKGAFSAWIALLHRKSLIKTSDETIISPLLESYFTNLTITDRTLRANPTKAYDTYFTDFTTLYSTR